MQEISRQLKYLAGIEGKIELLNILINCSVAVTFRKSF